MTEHTTAENLMIDQTPTNQPALEGFRLSPQQVRLWLLQEAGRGAFEAQISVRITGPLDLARLNAALQTVVQQHEILRTTFQCLPGMTIPLQVIREETAEESELLTAIGQNGNGNNGHGPNLAHGPLLWATVHQVDPDEHVLNLSLPSLCADTVGLENLVRDISRAYAGQIAGTALDLVNEEADGEIMQYADFAEWQHEILESDDAEPALAYWKQVDLTESLTAQLSFERALNSKFNGSSEPHPFATASVPIELDAALLDQLNAAAKLHTTTPATLLLTTWAIHLWRLTDQTEPTMGVAFSGRNYAELEDGIGLYARYLPLTLALTPDRTVAELIAQAETLTQEADAQQECFSWEEMGLVNIEENRAQWLPFGFEMAPKLGLYLADALTFKVEQRQAVTERFNIRLHCTEETSENIDAHFEHDTHLCEQADIARLTDQFTALLEQVCQCPERAIRGLSLLSSDARHQLVSTFNETDHDFGPFQPIHALFEDQVDRQPNAVAAIYEDDALTYRQLNERANALARHLQSHGVGTESVGTESVGTESVGTESVGTESLVAIDLDRGLDVLVAMLATLKAGGAYLPLDPKLPAERRATLLADAQPTVILNEIGALSTQGDPNPKPVLSKVEASLIPNPKSLAYVLYTSGSTGQPKGVGVTHANLSNYVRAVSQRLDLPEGASYATVTTFAADLGNTAIFPALCSGGSLHVISQDRASDPNALADYLSQHKIDCMKIVPSHLAALLSSDRAADLLPRKRLVIGGEALTHDLVAMVHALNPSCQIINHYGPTETTVGVTTFTVSNTEPLVPSSASSGTQAGRGAPNSHSAGDRRNENFPVPMGHPLANTQAYVLDRQMEPVPIWSAGELYIGGSNVSRGYLNRPDGTAERFVPDPFGAASGTRLYRTGDLVRRLPSGAVEFIGRMDYQIKIRGFRIELGEIESALRQHDAVSEAVVIGRETDAGETRLVAYVVAGDESKMLAGEVQLHLQNQLPDYMVPSAIVRLDALPLTANGKLDRRALPDPMETQTEGDDQTAPRTQIEEMVAGIWREVLGIEQVGLQDDFFALGGHSLLITRVAARLTSAFQVELPFQLLFELRTVAELAQTISEALRGGETAQSLPLVAASRDGDLPLSFAQQRLWFYDQLNPQSAVFNIPGCVRLTGPLDVDALEQTLSEIVARHEILRTIFPTVDARGVQLVHPPQPLHLTVADLSHLPEEQREGHATDLVMDDLQKPFDLAGGPLLRVGLIQLGTDDHIFHFTLHHIISDAWSMDLLVNEVATLYAAFVADEPSPLPALDLHYADYAHWQRTWLQGDVLTQHLDYWRQRLDGASTELTIPTDHPRPKEQIHRGERESIDLSPDLSHALRELSQRLGITLFMTLLGGFNMLVRHYTQEDDLPIGTNSANRSHAQTAGLIGFFVNQLVLRTDLSGNPTVRELLERVCTTALGAYAHQDLPFEKLVETLQPDRDMSRSLLFQIKVELQEGVSKELTLPNLTLEPMNLEQTIVRHDLHLLMSQTEAGLQGTMLYNADLYERETIVRLLDEYAYVLECMVADPGARIEEVAELLAARQRQRQAEVEETLAETSLSMLRGRKRQTAKDVVVA